MRVLPQLLPGVAGRPPGESTTRAGAAAAGSSATSSVTSPARLAAPRSHTDRIPMGASPRNRPCGQRIPPVPAVETGNG
jgi:hypothetical protein